MRVIRPAALATVRRRRSLLLALSMLASGVLAAELTLLGSRATVAETGVLASAAAVGLGIGAAWLARTFSPYRRRSAVDLLESLLAPIFDDSYALVLGPRLPIRDASRLDGLLVGPAGVRALTVRDWEGRYRVHGRTWDFHAGSRRGWIQCRTNPSIDGASLGDGVSRWAAQAGLAHVPVRSAVVFPLQQSQILLEEPDGEVVTADNGPWWANAIGRTRRLDPTAASAFVAAVLDAGDAGTPARSSPAPTVPHAP